MEGKKLFVRNLPYSIDDAQLRALFEEANVGTVESAVVIMDRASGRSKGFGFVEMSTPEEAEAAMNALNGKDLGGRPIAINEARPREERAPRY